MNLTEYEKTGLDCLLDALAPLPDPLEEEIPEEPERWDGQD